MIPESPYQDSAHCIFAIITLLGFRKRSNKSIFEDCISVSADEAKGKTQDQKGITAVLLTGCLPNTRIGADSCYRPQLPQKVA